MLTGKRGKTQRRQEDAKTQRRIGSFFAPLRILCASALNVFFSTDVGFGDLEARDAAGEAGSLVDVRDHAA
ncbi:MAG TPA: hypothetical protein VJ921_08390, partial [Vicinamibacteria bacterium]|nr:hypothetical protein [Vicinamibacteria bacterium]